MGDLLGEDDALASKNILYRCLDLLLDRKVALFSHLKSRWQDLFGIDDLGCLQDLTQLAQTVAGRPEVY
jgi:hypothetical protein